MKNQELFDLYISHQLSEKERDDFHNRIQTDAEFAKELRMYLITVKGIRQEEEQDCIEFAQAVKRLTKEKLQEIAGTRQVTKTNRISLKPYLWPLSIAAIVLFCSILTFTLQRKSRYALDEMIYYYNEPVFTNRGGNEIDIRNRSDKDLQSILPELEKIYKESDSPQAALTNGKGLAAVYIRLHQREKARQVLSQLIDQYAADQNYTDAVSECRNLLKQIE